MGCVRLSSMYVFSGPRLVSLRHGAYACMFLNIRVSYQDGHSFSAPNVVGAVLNIFISVFSVRRGVVCVVPSAYCSAGVVFDGTSCVVPSGSPSATPSAAPSVSLWTTGRRVCAAVWLTECDS